MNIGKMDTGIMVLIFSLIIITMLHILLLGDRKNKGSLYDTRDYILSGLIIIGIIALWFLTTFEIAMITTISLLILLIPCIIWLKKITKSPTDVCYGNKTLNILVSIFQCIAIIGIMFLIGINYEDSPWMTVIFELLIRGCCFFFKSEEKHCLQLSSKIALKMVGIVCVIWLVYIFYKWIGSMRRIRISRLLLPIFLIVGYLQNKKDF